MVATSFASPLLNLAYLVKRDNTWARVHQGLLQLDNRTVQSSGHVDQVIGRRQRYAFITGADVAFTSGPHLYSRFSDHILSAYAILAVAKTDRGKTYASSGRKRESHTIYPPVAYPRRMVEKDFAGFAVFSHVLFCLLLSSVVFVWLSCPLFCLPRLFHQIEEEPSGGWLLLRLTLAPQNFCSGIHHQVLYPNKMAGISKTLLVNRLAR